MPPLFADRYEQTGYLGGGGFGHVWRVHDHYMGQQAALKLFSVPSLLLAPTAATILTALKSPHVLRARCGGNDQDVPCSAAAVAQLGSVWDWMQQWGHPVPVDLAVRWVRHALVGLSVCHHRNLLHRDIKANNLFLQSLELC